MIPEGGFRNAVNQGYQYTLRSMKTQELRENRVEEIRSLDNTDQRIESKHMLVQYNSIKKLMLNMSFLDRGKNVLSTDIISNVLEQKRRERKIKLVIEDKNVDDYISNDISEINIYDEK